MIHHVLIESGGVTERLLTNTALIRLLTCVNPHMDGPIAGCNERLPTNTATMRPLTGVPPHVTG